MEEGTVYSLTRQELRGKNSRYVRRFSFSVCYVKGRG